MNEDKLEQARKIISSYDGPKLRIMEVCGTHTHEIFRLGIRKLLPENIDLISGRYVVDAKSIMGIFSMDISKPITLVAQTDNADECKQHKTLFRTNFVSVADGAKDEANG